MRITSPALCLLAAFGVCTALDLQPARADPAPVRHETFRLTIRSVSVDGVAIANLDPYRSLDRKLSATGVGVSLSGNALTPSQSNVSTEVYTHASP
jgi:hypothetical protein